MSFDNLNRNKIKRLNLALLILFTFLSLFSAFFVPFFGIAGMIFMTVPATLLVISGRIKDGIICVIIAGAFLIFFDYTITVIAVVLILLISFIYKTSIKKNKKKFFTISCIFMVFMGALALYFIINSAVYRINYVSKAINNYNNYVDGVFNQEYISAYAGLLSVEISQFEAVFEQVRNILKYVINIIPGVLISLIGFISFMNYVVTDAMLEKYNISIKSFPPFARWDLPWYWCWGIILALVLLVIPFGNQSLNKIFDIAGFNLLAVFGTLYIVLGVSVIWGLLEKFKISFFWRIIIFIFLGIFFSISIFVIIFMGLIDVWANFRRLERS
jgi:uncharacterized protein YybS (DUF2232 family)